MSNLCAPQHPHHDSGPTTRIACRLPSTRHTACHANSRRSSAHPFHRMTRPLGTSANAARQMVSPSPFVGAHHQRARTARINPSLCTFPQDRLFHMSSHHPHLERIRPGSLVRPLPEQPQRLKRSFKLHRPLPYSRRPHQIHIVQGQPGNSDLSLSCRDPVATTRLYLLNNQSPM